MVKSKWAGAVAQVRLEQEFFQQGAWKAYFYEDIRLIEDLWRNLQPANQQLLGFDFLKAVQIFPPVGFNFYYVILEKDGQAVGLSYFQLMDLDLDRSVKTGTRPEHWLGKLRFDIMRYIRSFINVKLLVCGNFLTSGDQSYHFVDSKYREEGLKFLVDTSLELLKLVSKQCKALKGVFFKDLPEANTAQVDLFSAEGFLTTHFQPRMLFELNPAWTHFDDYLAAITSKYRVKAKKAMSKIEDFEIRSMNADEIRTYNEAINLYFNEIISNVSFNALSFPTGYFANLKEELGSKFECFGLFKGGSFIGFYSVVHGNEELEAHYIGMRNDDNKRYKIYYNILLQLTKIGIDRGYKRINFSRTAMEIKSSIGAQGETLNCYYKHPNKLLQFTSVQLYNLLKPDTVKWQARSPFKQK